MKKLALLLTACLILAPLAAKDGDKKKGKKPKKELDPKQRTLFNWRIVDE